jgi:hypothetical protein
MSETRTKAHCNECGGVRWHYVLYGLKEQTPGDGSQVTLFELLRCAGCDEVRLRKTELASADRENNTKVRPRITYYPPSTIRPPPKWLIDLMLEQLVGGVTTEYDLLVEIYSALHNGAPSLAAMGVRAVIETLMINAVGDEGSFKKNLGALRSKGLISHLDEEHLMNALDVGSAAIHRGHIPKVEDVLSALDIAETLVKRLHIDKNTVAGLKKSTPPRSGR